MSSIKELRKLAEAYWRTVDWQKWTIKGLVIHAFAAGYQKAKEEKEQ